MNYFAPGHGWRKSLTSLAMASRSVAFHTLGCKLNFAESSTLSRQLEKDGFTRGDFDQVADIYVLNTCSVTENADRECRQMVRRIKRRAPDSLVVVTGCYAQLQPDAIAEMGGVDLVLGAREKFRLGEHLKNLVSGPSSLICTCDIGEVEDFNPGFSLHDRTRAFLKVQDGCDYQCSFCTIPLARGKSRSGTIAEVLDQARQLAEQGIKEIVLTGVNLGDFGRSAQDKEENFFELIRELDPLDGIQRFRISSIEPNLLTTEIIQFVAESEKFMPHFHIPLQSGSNRILGLMRRRYRRELYAEKLAAIRSAIPDCCIGADVITGFPSESEADFGDTLQFLRNLDISYLHVFTYSERNNTEALKIRPVVPKSVRQERTRILRELSLEKMQEFTRSQSGITRPVLFEYGNGKERMEGYSDNYIRVTIPFRGEWANQIVDWTL